MKNFKKSLLAVVALAAMGSASAETFYMVNQQNSAGTTTPETGQAYLQIQNQIAALGASDFTNVNLYQFANSSIVEFNAVRTTVQTYSVNDASGTTLTFTTIGEVFNTIRETYRQNTGTVNSASYTYNNGVLTVTINGTVLSGSFAYINTFTTAYRDYYNVTVRSIGALPANATLNPSTGQITANAGYVLVNGTPTPIGRTDQGGYVSAAGQVYSTTQADAWRVNQVLTNGKGTAIVANGITFVRYDGNSGTIYYAVRDGQIIGKTTDGAQAQAVLEAARKAEADAKAAAEEAAAKAPKKKDDHVAERTRKTNATVAGAVAINIFVDEVFGEELTKLGAGVGASVGGNFELPELNLGVSVDLEKHLGEDFKGMSVHASVGVESGELSVGGRKSWKVAEYVTASIGATIGAQGVRVGPELMICNGQFGIGMAMWGPVPIPQIKVFGYTASVVPHLALANAVVGGSTIAYKAIRSEMKKPAVKEAPAPVAPAVVEVAAQEFDSEEESID